MHRRRRDLEVQKKKGSIVRIKKVRKMCIQDQVVGKLNGKVNYGHEVVTKATETTDSSTDRQQLLYKNCGSEEYR